MRLALPIAAAVLLVPRTLGAQALVQEVPVVGGTAATARSLGIEVVPDRPRFFAELVRVIYDGREGKSADTDAKLARLAHHRDVATRFQSALAAVQPGTSGVSLAMTSSKSDRERMKDFLDLVGLKVREKTRQPSVEPTDNKQAVGRVRALADLGVDLGTLASRLNAGETVRIDIARETVPIPLSAKVWSDAIFDRQVTVDQLFDSILADRRAALVAHGLAGLDDETLRFLAEHPPLLARLYLHDAAAFASFGEALHIHDGSVVPAGGVDGVRAWEAVLGESVAQPDRFVNALFGASHGRVALIYHTLAHLDPPHLRFALGSWIPELGVRIEQFKTLVAAEAARDDWDVEIRPFARPPNDPSLLLSRVRVLSPGVPARPSARVFWRRAFESDDLPEDGFHTLRSTPEEGLIDAGWLAQLLAETDFRARGDKLDQLAFGQRAFGTEPEARMGDALVAVRGLGRFRMLMLVLDRIGIRNPAVYAAAARQAARLSELRGLRGFTALGQFQAAIAIVDRLVRVHSLTTAQAETLIGGMASVPVTADGKYAGAMTRWIERMLTPAIASSESGEIDALLVRALAGPSPSSDAASVSWEGHSYTVDLVGPEQRRVARAIEKMGAPPLRLALDLEHLAARISTPSATAPFVRQSIGDVRQVAVALTPKDKKAPVLPPGVEAPKSRADIAAKIVDELTKVGRPQDLDRAARAAESLRDLSDDVLADALMSLTYALDIGSPDGTTLLGGNVSRRHDFGFASSDEGKRVHTMWSPPTRTVEAGTPWHVSGSLLGLDAPLAPLSLRRIDTADLPQTPMLALADRETFTKTLARLNPFELTDADRDAIVAAIARGRSRISAMGSDAAAWARAAEEIRMDGWRDRAGRWAMSHDSALVPSFFSLDELMHLGSPPADVRLDRWGMASDETDACACIQAPLAGRSAIVVGRVQLGIATQVTDLNLRVAEVLSARHLPATLVPGVLAAAMQDYLDQVRPLHANDWLTLVRTAQAISDDRLDDYIAALTADGPLTATAAGGSPERKDR